MFNKIKELLFGKPAVVEAPYKVETPAPVGKPADEIVETTAAAPAKVSKPKAAAMTAKTGEKKPRAPRPKKSTTK